MSEFNLFLQALEECQTRANQYYEKWFIIGYEDGYAVCNEDQLEPYDPIFEICKPVEERPLVRSQEEAEALRSGDNEY